MPDFLIAWADPQPPDEVEYAQNLLPKGFTIAAPSTGDRERLVELAGRADAIMTQRVPLDADLIVSSGRLKIIQKYGGREDGIDLDAAERAGVRVAVMPLRGCIAVAELAMTLLLALSKQLVTAHEKTASGAYRDLGLTPKATSQTVIAFQWMQLPELFEVDGATLGIIGFGEIGTEIAKRARAFGMQVLYNKNTRLPTDIEQHLEVTFTDVDDLLARSKFVVLSAPHTARTERMIGERELGLMSSDAYLINVSRGGLVDEVALAAALRNRQISGAGLDVFVEEPVPADNPLLSCENVILTPHIGGGTGGAKQKQMSDVLNNIVKYASGDRARYQLV
jgi:phosphoglycerate dehydrogenase-like enzyme